MPMSTRGFNYLCIFNEICYLILIHFTFLFTSFVPSAETRYALGWGFIGVAGFALVVNFSILLYEVGKEVVRAIKKWNKNRTKVSMKEIN